jgi:hypothetical protein
MRDPIRPLRAKVAVCQSRLEEIALEIDGAPPAKALELRLERNALADQLGELKAALAGAEAEPRQLELPFDEPESEALVILKGLRERVLRLAPGAPWHRAFLVEEDVGYLESVMLLYERDSGSITPSEFTKRSREALPIGEDLDEIFARVAAIDARWEEHA